VEGGEDRKPVRRVWVPQVAVDVDTLWHRTQAAQARGLDPHEQAVVNGVREHLDKASKAAYRIDPLPRRLANWWHGTLVELAYRHLHAAQTELVDLYDWQELQAEVRPAVARASSTLNREDPRQRTVEDFRQYTTKEELRPRLRSVVEDSYAALDARHTQLRNFRNILLMAALSIVVLMAITLLVVAKHPHFLPLCFPNEVTDTTAGPVLTRRNELNCPTGSKVPAPTSGDVLVVALLGLLGGALTAAISIRNLSGTQTPYDVPVALAMLKVPLGAFSAVLGLVAIRGDFVPGLSTLDSQTQILAYALVLGFAQQSVTRLLDKQAQTLLQGLPSKDSAEHAPSAPPTRPVPSPVAVELQRAQRLPSSGAAVPDHPT
jgi:hypothetical protein